MLKTYTKVHKPNLHINVPGGGGENFGVGGGMWLG